MAGGVGDGDVVDAIGQVLGLAALRAAVQRNVALLFIDVSVDDATVREGGPDRAGKRVRGGCGTATDRGHQEEDGSDYEELNEE